MENMRENSRNIEFVSERPLNNGKSWERVLDTRDPECWRFRCSKKIWAVLLFFISSFGFFICSFSFLAAAAAIFLVLAVLLTVKMFSCTPTFDFDRKCFYCDRKKPRYGEVSHLKGYLPFSRISGIQIFYNVVHGSKGSNRQCYELNLMTDDLRRVFVAGSCNYSNIRKAAEMLAEKLNVPLKENDKNKVVTKPVPRWVAFIFLFLFSGMGLLGFVLNIIQPALKNWRSQEWQAVEAEVRSSQLSSARRKSKNSSYTVYKAEITYHYTVKGKNYSSSTYSFFHDFTRNFRKHKELLKNYPVGKKIVCYINPDNPEQAVMTQKMPPLAPLCAEAGCYLFFTAVGVGIFLLLWFQRKKD